MLSGSKKQSPVFLLADTQVIDEKYLKTNLRRFSAR
jgi:hypothetical protein